MQVNYGAGTCSCQNVPSQKFGCVGRNAGWHFLGTINCVSPRSPTVTTAWQKYYMQFMSQRNLMAETYLPLQCVGITVTSATIAPSVEKLQSD